MIKPNRVGFTKIKDKILAEAKSEGQVVIDEAKKVSAGNLERAKKEAAIIREDEGKRLEHDIKLFIDKTVALARLEEKKRFIERREDIISGMIESAVKDIRKSKDYGKYLKDTIKTSASQLGKGLVVWCNKADVSAVKSAASSLKIKAETKAGDMVAGVILEDSSGKRIEETIEARLERNRDEIRKAAAGLVREYEEPDDINT
ncbi:MAG: V-type ATP synthase subunit E [archaeon]